MALPQFPDWLPATRYAAVELRSFEVSDEIESETFVFLTDTQEWVVTAEEDAAIIRSVHPDAKIIVRD